MDKAIDQLEKIVLPSVSITVLVNFFELSNRREMVNHLEHSLA